MKTIFMTESEVKSKRLIKSGFTLIDLLITIGIIVLLATVILLAVGSARNQAKDAMVKNDLREISKMMDYYAIEDTAGKYFDNACTFDTSYVFSSSVDLFYTGTVPLCSAVTGTSDP